MKKSMLKPNNLDCLIKKNNTQIYHLDDFEKKVEMDQIDFDKITFRWTTKDILMQMHDTEDYLSFGERMHQLIKNNPFLSLVRDHEPLVEVAELIEINSN